MSHTLAEIPRAVRRAVSRPEGLLCSSFAALIALGTVALCLPQCQARGDVSVLDALFTSTSAVCVTGLIVVDTERDFSRVGQIVILVLIQLGGLGIMTLTALLLALVGSRVSLRSAAALQDAFFQADAARQLRRTLLVIVVLAAGMETAGYVLLLPAFSGRPDVSDPHFTALFHSVSAFCNAGFSNRSTNLEAFRSDYSVLAVIAGLVIAGGLGYAVWIELFGRLAARLRGRRPSPLNLSLHAAIALRVSLMLVALGAVALLALGSTARHDEPWSARIASALFHSVSARTAGFNTEPLGAMPLPTLLMLVGLMFIGGSPGSCAGGVKTTTAAVWLATLLALARGRDDATLGARRLPEDLSRRALLLVGLALAYVMFGALVLAVLESPRGARFEQLLFEQVSAFGTVGLSTGITPGLAPASKAWIILTMFVGRLGPLTMTLVVLPRRPAAARFPAERVMIG
jgi:trk system potassium uptake protein TrkH